MPAFSRVRNSAAANRSFSGSRRRALAKTGRPVVSTEWRTPCNGRGVAFPSPMIDGKAARRVRTAGVMWHNAAENLDGKAATAAESGLSVTASNTRRENGSTRRRCAARKSVPRIGLETAARINVHRKVRMSKHKLRVTVPHEVMGFPSAPVSGWPDDGDGEE